MNPLPRQNVPAISERADRRWLYLHHLNQIRACLFGDGIHTHSGLVKGEDNRLLIAGLLNQLQADLGIPSSVEPSGADALIADVSTDPPQGAMFS